MKLFYRMVLAALTLLLFMFRNAFKEKLKTAEIMLEAAQPFKPFQLLFIADIHRRKIAEDLIDFPVDIIVIGGDLTERGVPLKRVAKNIRILTNIAPVYFVWGNNDREVNEAALRKIFARFGVKVLDDESVELFGHSHLKLVGIDYFGLNDNKIESAYSNVKKEDTVIFVSHTPSIFNYIKEHYPADFLLAGHTHGGQIRLGKLGLYEKGALKKNGGKAELITNGFGTTSLHLRLCAEAEYHLFKIMPKRKNIRSSGQKL